LGKKAKKKLKMDFPGETPQGDDRRQKIKREEAGKPREKLVTETWERHRRRGKILLSHQKGCRP